MKLTFKIILSASLLIILLVLKLSCTEERPPQEKKRIFEGYGLWMDTVLKFPDKAIRGLEPGMSVAELKNLETISPSEEDSSLIYYEIKADSVTNVSITYSISEKKIDEIEMIIKTKSADIAAKELLDLKKYFEKKYPNPVEEKGIFVYSGKTTDGNVLKISIEDQSGVESGQISLLVYKDK